MKQIYVTWRVFTYLETVPVAFVLLWESSQVQTVLHLSCFWELVIIFLFFEIVPASLRSSWSVWSRTERQNPRINSWASEMYNWITTGSLYKIRFYEPSRHIPYKCYVWKRKKEPQHVINSYHLCMLGVWSRTVHKCEELTHLKRPRCWERLRAGGEGDGRGWDGWMASPTWWTWVWVNSRSWWWTDRPGVLQFMGS